MAGINYRRLFNTNIRHPFYVDGNSKKDLAVTPTANAALLMKNAGMLFRSDDSGFRVLYKANDDATPFINYTDVRLVFAMQLINATEFLNFTNLDDGANMYAPGKVAYFTNKADIHAPALTYALLDYLRPALFTYRFPQTTGNTGYIQVKNEAGADVTPVYPDPDNVKPDANNNFFYPIDFSRMPKGLYRFTTGTEVSGSAQTKTVYIDTELASRNVFGIVDIVVQDAAAGTYPIPDTDFVYAMNFNVRISRWKYTLVLKSPGTVITDPLSIADDGVQPPYGLMTFSRQSDTQVNGIDAAVFLSGAAVQFYEMPKKGLNVMKNVTPVINNIPGPAIGVVSAQANDFSITEIFVIL